MPNQLLANLDQAFRYAELVVDGISDDQRAGRTPCPDFDVNALVGHVVSGTRWYAEIPGAGVADPNRIVEADLTNRALSEAFRAEGQRARASWTEEQLAKEFPTPYAALSGAEMAGFMVMELVAHGIDLAMATGQDLRPDQELLETAFGVTTAMGDNLRVPKMMGPEVPVGEDAPLVDRFLGLIGRDPAWTPA